MFICGATCISDTIAMRYIDPLEQFGGLLLSVEKPGRYTGGEYGRQTSREASDRASLHSIIAFPDLYEIGMSNQAIKILYNRLNAIEGSSCDRVFSVAPDFEELLRQEEQLLYGLDTGVLVKDTDLLLCTLGYELGLNGFFSILELSGVALRSEDRKEEDPIVIMGGPCVSNPLPYASFVDAFWIGEAEGGFFELIEDLRDLKKEGAPRHVLLQRILLHPSIWARSKEGAQRAIDWNFSQRQGEWAVFPVPNMKVIHHHGPVEIMRGCPNGCRFCHAGSWYKPMRQKQADLVEEEVEAYITQGGYREITLSSLSSGDYAHLDSLIDRLNETYRERRISFQLPSLHVSSFSLKLLSKINQVRKSGLTFAVETPEDFWQLVINKQVSGSDIVSILAEAKRQGWKGAKFYFMIGLPLGPIEGRSEEEGIVHFIEYIAKKSGMKFNINVGTFIPKPHSPFQWAAQLHHEEAERKFEYLRNCLKPQGHKISFQHPLISTIEGILSRGDEGAGELFYESYQRGCRLDAWTEFFNQDIWKDLLAQHRSRVEGYLSARDRSSPLPWSSIASGVKEAYFLYEEAKAQRGELTSPCIKNCTMCGICSVDQGIEANGVQKFVSPQVLSSQVHPVPSPVGTHRLVFSFAKQGPMVFHAHLGLIETLSMALIRAALPVMYTQGFNPLPRMELASPLSLGLSSKGEVASVDLLQPMDPKEFIEKLNAVLPQGLEITQAHYYFIPLGKKKYSLSSLHWGSAYTGPHGGLDLVHSGEEKAYRLGRLGPGGTVFDLERHAVLAVHPAQKGEAQEGVSYFSLIPELYPPG